MYLNSLSAGHPASLGVHHDIKLMMPISVKIVRGAMMNALAFIFPTVMMSIHSDLMGWNFS
jgi:hypothetical protein